MHSCGFRKWETLGEARKRQRCAVERVTAILNLSEIWWKKWEYENTLTWEIFTKTSILSLLLYCETCLSVCRVCAGSKVSQLHLQGWYSFYFWEQLLEGLSGSFFLEVKNYDFLKLLILYILALKVNAANTLQLNFITKVELLRIIPDNTCPQ